MRTRLLIGVSLLSAVAMLFVVDALLDSRVAVSSVIVILGILAWCELAVLGGVGRRASGGGPLLFLVGLVGTASFLLVGWQGAALGPGLTFLGTVGIPLLLPAAFAAVLFREDPRTGFQPLLLTVLGVLFCGFLLSFLLRIYQREHGTWLGVFFLLGVKGNDIAAYFVGKRYGRTHVFRVSPKKTLEGAIAALAFGAAWFGIGSWARPDLLFPWPTGLAVGIIVSVASQMGDLSESLIKRYYQVKDSGVLLPEFGGALDLLDSFFYCGILFCGALEALR